MKKVLITGVTGFAGSFLAENLITRNDSELHGTYLSDTSLENISSIKDSLTLHKIDLTDTTAVTELISLIQPDEIYHLAALPSPAESFDNPQLYIHNNIDVELNVLEAVRKLELHNCRLLIVSSAEVYGIVDQNDLPIDEDTSFRPASPYSVSKAAQDLLAFQYFLSYKMPIIRVRPFNHIGPRQSAAFVVAAFAKQIAEIEKTGGSIKVGNLDSKRDFTDVRDMVDAYRIVMEKGIAGEVYNLGRGESIAIKQVLNELLNMSTHQLTVEVDAKRLRPSDVPDLVCNTTKISSLGWSARIPLSQTLKDTLDYWRAIV